MNKNAVNKILLGPSKAVIEYSFLKDWLIKMASNGEQRVKMIHLLAFSCKARWIDLRFFTRLENRQKE